MIKFGKAVVKLRIPILILSIFLLIPSAIGYFNTRVNYDILTYLPEEIETMKGQDLLLDEFGTGAFSFCVVEGMDAKDIFSNAGADGGSSSRKISDLVRFTGGHQHSDGDAAG